MNISPFIKKQKKILSLILITLSVIAGAFILAGGLKQFRVDDRSISVRGFAEREVMADMAVWTLRTRVASDDITEATVSMDKVKQKLEAFLLKNGIQKKEIIQQNLVVSDKKAQDYGNYNEQNSYRYIVENSIQVRSTNVKNVQKVSRMTDALLKAGVMLSNNEYDGSVRYYYTKLQAIKPAMLVEAIRNARDAAEQFSQESEVSIGKLKHASQGYFSIVDRDESMGQADDGYAQGVSDIYKKVRVVISVDYSIK